MHIQTQDPQKDRRAIGTVIGALVLLGIAMLIVLYLGIRSSDGGGFLRMAPGHGAEAPPIGSTRPG